MKKLALCKLFPPGEKFRRLMRVMKITWLIILLASLQISASVYSQQTTFSVEFKDASLYDLMKEIKSNSEFDFIYSDDEIESVKINDADFYGSHIEEILDECLDGTEITYTVEDKVIILMPAPPKPMIKTPVQKYEVRGTVTDKDGVALPGVSVVIKGTSIGTATDIDGNYMLKLEKPSAVLVFSFVGMLPQEVNFNGQKVLNVTLTADTESLSEVVITGYTKTSRVRQSSSSTKISQEDVNRQVTTNLDDKMEGLSTGLNITSVSPDGGQERLELVLRGISTFDEEGEASDPEMQARNSLNRQPLIVVDGFPYEGPFNDIDPSTIESIDVLKDAAATALWGLRASNGVIVISTKRGKQGKPRVSLSTNFTFGTKMDLGDLGIASSPDIIAAKSAYMKLNPTSNTAYNAINYAAIPGWWNPAWGPYPYPVQENWGNKYTSMDAFSSIWADFYAGTISETERDQQLTALGQNDVLPEFKDKFLRGGTIMQNSVNINGGSDFAFYNLAISHTDEKRPNKGDDFERLNLSLTTDLKLNERLRATVDVSLATSETNYNAIGVGALYTGTVINRYDKLTDASGNPLAIKDVYAPFKDEFLSKGFDDYSYSPIIDSRYQDNNHKNYNLRLAGGLNYKVTDWLTADLKYQVNKVENTIRNHRPVEQYMMRREQNSYITAIDDGTGSGVTRAVPYGEWLERKKTVTTYSILRGSLNFNKVFADDHVVSGTVGMEATENEYTSNQQKFVGYSDKTGLYSTTFEKNQWASNHGQIDDTYLGYGSFQNDDLYVPETISRTVSSFSNFGYSYKAKYNIEGSLKVDQATAFGINKKLSKNLYWAVSGSWNAAKEEFLQAEWLDELKLRGSYGVNGNMRRGLTTMTTIRFASSSWTTGRPYATIDNPGNPNLAPEETTTVNLGFDFGLFNRLRGSIDVYDKHSKDLLVTEESNPSYALGKVMINAGEIKNRGIELFLQADLVKTKDFKWQAAFNFSYNKNEVKKFGERVPTSASSYYYDITGGRSKVIGEDVSAEVRYKWAGLDENGDPQVYNRNGDIIKWNDPEFDSMTQEDMVVTKPFTAPTFGSLSQSFKYKNFTLSAMLTYKFGHVFQENLLAKYPYIEPFDNTQTKHVDVANAWKQAGDENFTDIPAMPTSLSQASYNRKTAFQLSDYAMHDASHIRLKDITLNYEFNKELIQKVGISRASLMFQVRNLGLLWTANSKNIDPESVPFSGRSIYFGGNFPQAYRPGIKVPVSFVVGAKIDF
ncbi:SusC/RagA family TonB-linked outer membrane protein [Marinifilum caeruleilacunae]|uniref:SusC/RagA family TonB-linked outer membrane protein n=1 Tax=Marinifilum caeruleilacunae TaxID=2499076 RepID=A0ABX1WT84_9BACT|nr:SusC/RagA family TonB-linked outer membrane protein [Marinifilum caeruleilacunae]NOU59324.1 SusC/RagA family TonB-linked outer membrane protein [Marinifilum caeruleilacunae]